MVDTADLMEARRAVLQKYLRGEFAQAPTSPRAIPRRPPGSPVPLSFGQEQLWFLTHLAPEVPAYNEAYTVCLPGPLDVAALERSFNEIIRRHEIWRTTFPTVDGQPIQVIHPAPTLRLPVVDLRELPVAGREAEALRRATEEAQQPFDLAQGPLLRATLMQLDATDYRLYLTLHHAIFDGVSIYNVFLPELATLYQAFARGQPSPLPEPPLQYADFAHWQRKRLQGAELTAHLAYWREQLAGPLPVLQLPTDRTRPAQQSFRGALQRLALSRHLTAALRALSQREGVTLFMTLLAAFATLLYRYTGQEDLLVGTVTGGRKRPELEKLMGFFLNTVVLRPKLTGDPTFRQLLGRVRQVTLGAYAHDEVPFEHLVMELQAERDLSRNPLFQVMLALNPSLPALEAGWTVTEMDVDTGAAKFDLVIFLEERTEDIIGYCEYNPDLFDAPSIARLVGHWQTLLEGVVTDPDQRLTELPLLTAAERQQLLVDWSATETPYPRDLCVHQLFEAQVERAPDAVAVVFEDQQLTYQELNERANQVAHHLQRLGVGPEVLVGICVERSLAMVIGLLGILKAGGGYVPLDPTYPAERLAFMLQDAEARVLLTQRRLIHGLPAHDAHVVCLDADWEGIAQHSDANPVSGVQAENLAYVIYTSGSTGRPKGVAIRHQCTVNFVDWAGTVFTSADLAGVLAATSLCFDLAVFELFVPLSRGGTVILAENALQLPVLARAQDVTLINTVPSAIAELLRIGSIPATVRAVNLAGEPLPRALVEQLYGRTSVERVFNLYGPTETTTYSTYTLVERRSDRNPTIGRPIANTQVYILDQNLQPVPVGVPGELHIGGDGLARGYLNRPELTAEKFISHPFSSEPGARLYKTGDLARYCADGTIEFLGRIDNQVKIRGFRIELGEIEAVLAQHPALQDAVVLAREDVPGDKRLVAYFVPSPDAPLPSADELRQYLQQRLPAYMVPAAFVPLEALPLTPNGKVDRKALPVPDQSRAVQGAFVAPRTAVEELLAGIWAEALKVEHVGIHDNFFELGGHSLLAVRLVHRIEQAWGKKIALATLFAGPTIAQLAQALLEVRDDESGVRTPVRPLQTGGSRRPFFFLHGHYLGTAYYCFRLARDLGPDQPFYALDPYKLDDLPVPPSLETIAATHLEAVRAVQPDGPYLLGGFCNGGLVAYEMARQLHALGQAVDLLVLMNPTPLPQGHRIWYRVLRGVIKCGGSLVGLGPEQQVAWFVRLRHLVRRLYSNLRGYRWDEAEAEHPALAALILTDEALYQDYVALLHWALLAYRPSSVYPGKVTFFWPAQRLWHARSWRPVAEATEVEEHLIPGRESTWKTDHLPALSECLRLCLDNAHAARTNQ